MKIFCLCFALAAPVLGAQVTGGVSGDPIKFGAILPLAGPIASFGVQTRNGMEMAIGEFNGTGGLNGRPVVLITEDDGAQPEKTDWSFQKLEKDPRVSLILGALTSKCTLAIHNLARSERIALITPTSTNGTLTRENPWFFRACYEDAYQGGALGKYALENARNKKAAILVDPENSYSLNAAIAFKAVFTAGGGSVTEFKYSGMDRNFVVQALGVMRSKAEVVFIPDYYPTVAEIVPQIRAEGYKGILIGTDGWDTMTDSGLSELLGTYYTNHWVKDSGNLLSQAFMEDYYKRYGAYPNVLAVLGYDAAKIALDALKKAGTDDREALREALETTDGDYLTGRIRMRSGGLTEKSMVLVKIQSLEDGSQGVEFSKTLNP